MEKKKLCKPLMSEAKTYRFINILKKEGRCIWDPTYEYYNNKFKVTEAWMNVADKTGTSVERAKVKWKNLRDLFRREVKKFDVADVNNYTGRWQYMRPLWFIHGSFRNLVPSQPMAANADDETLEEDMKEEERVEDEDDEVYGNYDNENGDNENAKNSAAEFYLKLENASDYGDSPIDAELLETESDPIETVHISKAGRTPRNIAESSSADYDEMFLRSLAPYLRSLEPLRKLTVRCKIQQLIADEMKAQERARKETC